MAITLDGTNGINSSGVIVAPDGTASAPSITNDGDTNTGIFFPAADTIAFAEGGAEAMRLNSSGNVGIGVTSYSAPLHVEKDTGTGIAISILRATGTSNNGLLVDTTNTPDTYVADFRIGNASKMRIDSSGYLLVGTTSQPTNGPYRTVVDGGSSVRPLACKYDSTGGSTQIAFINPNGQVGAITTTNSSTAFVTSSDYRLKENIAPMTGALATVAQLNPVTYNWKSNGSAGQGFIAHELQAVVPDCVSGEKDAVDADGNPVYQGIDTSFLVATLTAAIKEQQTIIESLQARIEALENNNV